tara:strand:+ start:4171 stop:4398 length:228 start_codon:yes stop_codon:yes gene_type:complete
MTSVAIGIPVFEGITSYEYNNIVNGLFIPTYITSHLYVHESNIIINNIYMEENGELKFRELDYINNKIIRRKVKK